MNIQELFKITWQNYFFGSGHWHPFSGWIADGRKFVPVRNNFFDHLTEAFVTV